MGLELTLTDAPAVAAVATWWRLHCRRQTLAIPKSRIRRRLSGLPASLRSPDRSARPGTFKVTDIGRNIYRHARAALPEADCHPGRSGAAEGGAYAWISFGSVLTGGRTAFCRPGSRLSLRMYPKLRLQMIVSHRRNEILIDPASISRSACASAWIPMPNYR